MLEIFILYAIIFAFILFINSLANIAYYKQKYFDVWFHKNIISEKKYTIFTDKFEKYFAYILGIIILFFIILAYMSLIVEIEINIITVLIAISIIFILGLSFAIKDLPK